jgi:hypothetical protein
MVASSITLQILLQSGVFWIAVSLLRSTFLSLTILTQSSWPDSDFTMVENMLSFRMMECHSTEVWTKTIVPRFPLDAPKCGQGKRAARYWYLKIGI